MKVVPNSPISCPKCLFKSGLFGILGLFFSYEELQGNYNTIHYITKIMYICKEKWKILLLYSQKNKIKLVLYYTSNFFKKEFYSE